MINAVEAIWRAIPRKRIIKKCAFRIFAGALFLWAGLCLCPAVSSYAQQPPAKPQKETPPPSAPTTAVPDQEQILPGDWGPELLYSILSSPNEEAQFELVRATFAAGPAIIPSLPRG